MHVLARAALVAASFSIVSSISAADAPNIIRVDAKQMQSLHIETAPLGASGDGTYRSLPAQVVIPNAQIRMIAAPLAGLVQTLAVAPNDTVKQGQLLARLQSPMLVDAQREYLQAASQAQLAQANFKRDEQLFKEGIIAEGRYLATQATHVQANAVLSQHGQVLRLMGMGDGALAALRAGRGMSSTLDIVAPISGTILEQMAATGQRVEAATPIYKLAQLNPLWLEMQATPAAASGIMPGAAVSVNGATGKVLSVGRHLSAGTQTVTIRASLSKGTEQLGAGQFVEARVALKGDGGKQWQVPTGALARHQGKVFVFAQVKDGFVPIEVKLLGESPALSAIAGALRGDERIAVKGIAALKAAWVGTGEGEGH